MRIFLLALCLAISSQAVLGDGPFISGDFRGLTFSAFAAEVEQQLPYRFVFRDGWVKDVRMTAQGDSLDLYEVLEKDLSGKDLSFYLDGYNRIFVFPGDPLVTQLPGYFTENGNGLEQQAVANGEALTRLEELYMTGRKEAGMTTLTIGSSGDNPNGSETVISGEIKDRETGEPLIGATVYIEELSRGFVSNRFGEYSLGLPPGTYTTRFNCLGMEEIVYQLKVISSGKLDIDMAKKLYSINEITVKADKYDYVRGVQMGFEQIPIKNIKEIPVVMGEKDLIRVVNLLPGVQTAGEGSSGIYVRGSAADQNMFMINQIPVYNTSHLLGFFSAFNPDIIRDFSFYKGNLPARYGGRLASVIDISARQGNNKQFSARGGISPITAHAALEGPIVKDRTSMVLGARSTYSDWILSRVDDPDVQSSDAFFYDLAGGINHKQNEKNLLKVFGYYSKDRFSLASTNNYAYSNAGASLGWWHRYSSSMYSETSLAGSRYRFSHEDLTIPLEAYRHEYRIDHFELKTDFNWQPVYRHEITFGAGAILYDLDRGEIQPLGEASDREYTDLGRERGVETAFYISDKIPVTGKLTVQGGIRYSLFAYLGPQKVNTYLPGNPLEPEFVNGVMDFKPGEIIRFYSGPEIRASLSQLLGENNSVKLSYNNTRQYLYMLSNTFAISPIDQWKLCDYYISPAVADQYSFGFYQDLAKKTMHLSAEVYYKNVRNILEYKDGADFISSPDIETEVLSGKQEAYGVELMMKKDAGKLTGWMSFAWARSLIQVNGEQPWQKINEGKVYPANYDIPYSLNLVLNYRFNRRLSYSANVVYHTGRPVTYPIAAFRIDGKKYMYYSDRNEYRIPDYFRIDMSLNLEGNLKARKLAHSYWMLNVYNLTGRRNAYSVYFKTEGDNIRGYKLSIFGQPIITLSWNFKFGNYASD